MKLRVTNNSIRLRLTEIEVAAFDARGAIEETIEFGPTDDKRLTYRLAKAEIEIVNADFTNGKITIFVPTTQAENWAKTTRIGIKAEQNLGGGKTLQILIEKDLSS